MSYSIIKDDLFNATTEYIVQQTNCTSTHSQGLSAAIAEKWPAVQPYSDRKPYKGHWAREEDRDTPGTIKIYKLKPPSNIKGVICAFAQYTHGKPGTLKDPLKIEIPDSAADRVRYFGECLEAIATLEPMSVGFPYRIGCGLAGGSWKVYERMLQRWAEAYPTIDVVVYQL